MKLSITTIITGIANNKFSLNKIAGMLKPNDKTSNDRFAFEPKSKSFNNFIILKLVPLHVKFQLELNL